MRNKDTILLENIYTKNILKEMDFDRHGYFPDDQGNEPLDGVDPAEIYPEIKLIDKDGYLYTPYDVANKSLKDYYKGKREIILVDKDETGDVVTARWPNYNERDLRMLLYGARETGQIPNIEFVILPDGKEFEIN
jgi:hypothetical protein